MKRIVLSILGLAVIANLATAQTYTKTTEDSSKKSQTTATEGGHSTMTLEKSLTESETEIDNTVIVNQFDKNWEFFFALGTQAYIGEYTHTHFLFKDWWTGPAIDLKISKWASPFFGLGLGVNISPYKGLYSDGDTMATFARFGEDPKYTGKGGSVINIAGSDLRSWYGNVFLEADFNLTNVFGGYRRDRVYNLIGYVGGGVAFPFKPQRYNSVTASFNAGLINQIRLSSKWNLNIAVRGALYGDSLNGINYYSSGDKRNIPLDGMIGLTVGASYKFGFVNKKSVLTGEEVTTEWIPMTTAVIASKEYAEVVEEAKQISDKAAETQKVLESKIEKQQGVIVAQKQEIEAQKQANKVEPTYYRQLVNFEIDKWVITNREKVSIMLAAEVMKKMPEKKFSIIGYADKQTATPKRNKILSQNRARVVKEMLVKEFGIPESQLVVDDKGGVDYMFYLDPQCSRSVIIETIL